MFIAVPRIPWQFRRAEQQRRLDERLAARAVAEYIGAVRYRGIDGAAWWDHGRTFDKRAFRAALDDLDNPKG